MAENAKAGAVGFKEFTPSLIVEFVHIKGDRNISLDLRDGEGFFISGGRR